MLKLKNKEIDIKTKRKIGDNRLPLMRLEPVTAWLNIFMYAKHYTIEIVAYTYSCIFLRLGIISANVQLVNILPTW